MLLGDEPYAPAGPDWLVSWPPVWSGDSSTIACRLTSRAGSTECVALDGKRGEEFDRVGSPALSRNGNRVAYRAQRGSRSFLVVGAERGPEVEFMSDPALSADGRVAAVALRRDGRWTIQADGREIPVEGPPSHVFLSPDGRSVGWVASSGTDGHAKVRVVVDGKAGEPFALVGKPVFAPDGRRVTYAADDGEKQYVVIGDAKVEVSGRLSDPVFSPDGTKVGYGALIGGELWWKVLEAP
jgi:Tol biopolymer transport system component